MEKLYEKRQNLSTSKVVEQIKSRISFWNIFNLWDRLDKFKVNQLDAKNSNYQKMLQISSTMQKRFDRNQTIIDHLLDHIENAENKLAKLKQTREEESNKNKRQIEKLQRALKSFISE